MFAPSSALSRRITTTRARRRARTTDQWYLTDARTSLDEAFFLTLGSGTWRPHPLLELASPLDATHN
jgi:hypothetical protein